VWGLIFWAWRFTGTEGRTELPRQFGYKCLSSWCSPWCRLIISVLFYFTVGCREDPSQGSNPEVVIDVTPSSGTGSSAPEDHFGRRHLEIRRRRTRTQKAMESKPEGVDAHGEELVGAVRGLNPRTGAT